MAIKEIPINYSGIDKTEKSVEFRYKKDRINVRVSKSPLDGKILACIYINGFPVVLNRVCVIGEGIAAYNTISLTYDKDYDICFLVDARYDFKNGSIVSEEDLGSRVKLYLLTEG